MPMLETRLHGAAAKAVILSDDQARIMASLDDAHPIMLTQGWVAIVNERYAHLDQYKWTYNAVKSLGHRVSHSVIRFIPIPGPKKLQHVSLIRTIYTLGHGSIKAEEHVTLKSKRLTDFKILDYRLENVLAGKTVRNQTRQKTLGQTSSRYQGVFWVSKAERREARIYCEGRRIYLGRFTTEEEAARAYNKAALQHFGEHAYQNEVD
jgi:hypothetical protein